jgi:hypothetical protein
MRSVTRTTMAFLAMVTSSAAFQNVAAQVDSHGGWVSILEPSEWRGEGTRGIVVRQRRSLRVSGLAYQPSGVTGILINGEPATVTPIKDGQVRFVGYVVPASDAREVEVVVYSAAPPLVRKYGVRVVAAAHTYEKPADAWDEAGGGFLGQRFAVVVGVSEYNDSSIHALRYADDDARAFYQFLLSDRAGLGGFDKDNVELLLNDEATYRNIRTALFSFLMKATERDVVVLYFAGHGAADPYRPTDYYLLSYDTEVGSLAGTALPMSDVSEAVHRLRARDVIVITDACHSAAVGGQMAMRSASPNAINRTFLEQMASSTGGYVTITASEVTQYSQEDARWGGGHGAFTYYLLQGLDGAADQDQDRIVTLGEAFEYVRDRVQRDTRNAQVPTVSQTPWDRSWPMSIVLEEPSKPQAAEPQERPKPVSRPAAQKPVPQRPAAAPEKDKTQVAGTMPYPGTGVWLRVNLGGGQTAFDTDGASVSGAAGQISFAIGTVVGGRVALFGLVSTDLITGPELTLGTTSVTTDKDVTASQTAFGAGVGLLTRSNVFLSAALLFPKMTLKQTSSNLVGESKIGMGLELVVAKDWPVRPTLSLGVGARAFFGSMKDRVGTGQWNAKGFGITGSLTYMPKGLPNPTGR